jgi:nucleotide-binding universal stress UspA family protein
MREVAMNSSDPLSPGVVVVGVDGSAESLAAVDLAAREATLRSRPLLVVHGMEQPYLQFLADPKPDRPAESALHQHAERVVSESVARARNAAPTIEVLGEVMMASGAQALISHSHGASLVVVGYRGLGAFTGLLVGSIAIHVASHATCPVLIARGTMDPALPVLLAADGSPANDPAVRFAFEEAAMRGAPLVALHVWSHPASRRLGDTQLLIHEAPLVDEDGSGMLAEALASSQDEYPHVAVRRQVVNGRTRKTIIDATGDAQLVVLGARGHGGFAGLLLGSVSQAVLRHATCATAIVPHPHG